MDPAQNNNTFPVDTSFGDGAGIPPTPPAATPPLTPPTDATAGNQPVVPEAPPAPASQLGGPSGLGEPPGDGQTVTTFKPVRGKFGPKGIIATVFGILLLVAATIVGITQVGQVQIFREKASGVCTGGNYVSCQNSCESTCRSTNILPNLVQSCIDSCPSQCSNCPQNPPTDQTTSTTNTSSLTCTELKSSSACTDQSTSTNTVATSCQGGAPVYCSETSTTTTTTTSTSGCTTSFPCYGGLGTSCTDSGHLCQTNLTCVDGICFTSETTGGGTTTGVCSVSNPCSSGFTCVNGACQPLTPSGGGGTTTVTTPAGTGIEIAGCTGTNCLCSTPGTSCTSQTFTEVNICPGMTPATAGSGCQASGTNYSQPDPNAVCGSNLIPAGACGVIQIDCANGSFHSYYIPCGTAASTNPVASTPPGSKVTTNCGEGKASDGYQEGGGYYCTGSQGECEVPGSGCAWDPNGSQQCSESHLGGCSCPASACGKTNTGEEHDKPVCSGLSLWVNGDYIVSVRGKPKLDTNGNPIIAKGWHPITSSEFKGLGAGDTVRFYAIGGSKGGKNDATKYNRYIKARFIINGTKFYSTNYIDLYANGGNTGPLYERDFYYDYVIPAGVTNFHIKVGLLYKNVWICGTKEIIGQGHPCFDQSN